MATDTLLRFKACHRGIAAGSIRTAMNAYPDHYMTIKRGALKGCVRNIGAHKRSVYKLGRGFVLEFSIVIRPGWPEDFIGKPLPGHFDADAVRNYRESYPEAS